MAISSETSSASFVGNASTVTAYTLGFPFSGASEIVVTHIDEDGVRATLAITTGYTLHGDYAAGTGTLKTVVAIPVTDTLLVERFTAVTQTLESSSPSGSYPTSIETQLDRTTRAVQDIKRIGERNLARSLRVPDGELAAQLPAAATRKGRVPFFNSTTGAVETATPAQIFALSDGAPASGIGLPTGGTAGQYLRAIGSGAGAWANFTYVNAIDYGATGDGSTDDSAAIQAAIAAAAASNSTRTVYLPPGEYLANVTLPENIILRGAGVDLKGDLSPPDRVTTLLPADDAEPVILITDLAGQEVSHLDIYGNGAGTSVAGIKIANGLGTYPGMGFHCERVRVNGFTDGILADSPNGLTFIDVSVVYCNYCWRGINLSDTWQLINCHGNFYNTAAVSVATPRCVVVNGGDWGNASAPLLLASGGGNVIWENTNIETVNNVRFFETTNSNLTVSNNRIALNALTTAVLVRQTTSGARCHFENNKMDGADVFGTYSYPLVWETNTTSVPEPTSNSQPGIYRQTNAGWSSTTRSWRNDIVNVFAYRTSNQTGMTTGTTTAVTFSAETSDPGAMFDIATGVFTVPASGLYHLDAAVILNAANTGYTRLVERLDGADAAIIRTDNNHEQYRGLNGSVTRYLTVGQTWGVGIAHDKGSDMSLYGTGAGGECWLSISRV